MFYGFRRFLGHFGKTLMIVAVIWGWGTTIFGYWSQEKMYLVMGLFFLGMFIAIPSPTKSEVANHEREERERLRGDGNPGDDPPDSR